MDGYFGQNAILDKSTLFLEMFSPKMFAPWIFLKIRIYIMWGIVNGGENPS